MFRIKLSLGFKNHQRLNVYIRQIVQQLLESGELPAQKRKYSIYGASDVGNFKFCFIRRANFSGSMPSRLDEIMLSIKYTIRRMAGSQIRWYGLDTSSLIIEHVPLTIGARSGEPDVPVRQSRASCVEASGQMEL